MTAWHDEAPYQTTPPSGYAAPGFSGQPTPRTSAIASLFRDVRRMLGIQRIRTGHYTPKTNGEAEYLIQSQLRCGLLYPFRSFHRRAEELPSESVTTREGTAEPRPTSASSAFAGTT